MEDSVLNIEYGKTSQQQEDAHLIFVQDGLKKYKNRKQNANRKAQELLRTASGESNEAKISIIEEAHRMRSIFDVSPKIVEGLRQNPYFARLDFAPSTDEKKVLYLSKGSLNFVLERNGLVNYVDWRAPIAELYYRYSQMPAKQVSFKGPHGTIYGNIDLVARIKIKNSHVTKLVVNTSGSAREALEEKLNAGSSDKMHEIVDTIQSEQIELIRYDPAENLIIQGAAGSGKTAIALHRVAQLLYDRDNYNDGEILFISPNKQFSTYISEVLPELNVNVPIKTLDELYKEIFYRQPNPVSDVIEKYFVDGISYELKSHLSEQMDNGFHNAIFLAEETRRKLRDYNDMLDRMLRDEAFMLNQGPVGEKKKVPQVARFRPLPSKKALDDWVPHNYRRGPFPMTFSPVFDIDNNIDFVFWAIMETILNNYTYRNKKPDSSNTKKEYDIKHVIVDEAQDYTKWHLYLLHLLMPKAKFTILGDKNQNINPYMTNSDFGNLLSEVAPESKYIEIRKSYRSSPEIIEYSNRIVGSNIVAVRKSQNKPVDEFNFNSTDAIRDKDIDADIDFLTEDGHKRIAIITRDNRVAELIKTDDFAAKGIMVLPVYEAKGLEFDAAIVINNFDDDEKEMFYTACTRAMNKLIVYNVRGGGA